MPRSRQTCRAGSVMRAPAQPEQGAPEPVQEAHEEQQPAMEPAHEQQQPASDEDVNFDSDDEDADNYNWEPPTTDEDQDLMPARGPEFQAALLESFQQHRDRQHGNRSVEETNEMRLQRGVQVSLERHELEERARVDMQAEREALLQFRRETAEDRRAHEAEAAAAEAAAEAQAGRSARMSMDRLRRRTVTAERHHAMATERRARRDRMLARANDGEAGPSDVQGQHGGDGDAE